VSESSIWSRRDALKWAGAAGVAGALSLPAVAEAQTKPAAAAASLHGAGFYKTQVGDLELIVVSDGHFMFSPPEAVFGSNVGKAAVHQALEEAFVSPKEVIAHLNTLLIRTPSDLVLVDTGSGGKMGPTTGKLQAHLANAGIKPTDITAVLLTHAHPDHFGGLSKQAFPNAEFLIAQTEYDFWTGDNPDLSKSGLPIDARPGMVSMTSKLLKDNTWTKFDGEKEIKPKIRVIPAPGGTNQFYYVTDAAHHFAINLPHPDYYVAFDVNPEQAIETRKTILDRAAADKLLVAGAHLPFPAVGHVKKTGDAFAWVPAVWKW
jgi:glyoxylase-like metal-dependent hydrolase (beta-lactamase superfamily II)